MRDGPLITSVGVAGCSWQCSPMPRRRVTGTPWSGGAEGVVDAGTVDVDLGLVASKAKCPPGTASAVWRGRGSGAVPVSGSGSTGRPRRWRAVEVAAVTAVRACRTSQPMASSRVSMASSYASTPMAGRQDGTGMYCKSRVCQPASSERLLAPSPGPGFTGGWGPSDQLSFQLSSSGLSGAGPPQARRPPLPPRRSVPGPVPGHVPHIPSGRPEGPRRAPRGRNTRRAPRWFIGRDGIPGGLPVGRGHRRAVRERGRSRMAETPAPGPTPH